jgi:hypothetical protein
MLPCWSRRSTQTYELAPDDLSTIQAGLEDHKTWDADD